MHHFLAWGLSLDLARKHFSETQLVTDRAGKQLLVDQLGLEFDTVTVVLDQLNSVDPGWWSLGKLVAYSLQQEPFAHLDTDVFLWKPLPRSVASAAVFTQSPEYTHQNDNHHGLDDIDRVFRDCGEGLPIEWQWMRSIESSFFKEENCGILGGSDTQFLQYYALSAIDLILNPKYQLAWNHLPHKSTYAIPLEQFYLSACLDYHRTHPNSPFRNTRVAHLFSSWEEIYNPVQAARVGYTHLLGDAKTNPAVSDRLELRVRREQPTYFRRCHRLASQSSLQEWPIRAEAKRS